MSRAPKYQVGDGRDKYVQIRLDLVFSAKCFNWMGTSSFDCRVLIARNSKGESMAFYATNAHSGFNEEISM